MSYLGIHVGDHGWTAQLVFYEDGVAVDVSGYDTLRMIFIKPDGTSVAKDAVLNDSNEAAIDYIVEDGVIDQPGHWLVFGRVASTSPDIELTSSEIRFIAKARED